MVGTTKTTKLMILMAATSLTMACSRPNDWPGIDESGNESASVVDPITQTPGDDGDDETPGTPKDSSQKLILNQAMTIRYEKSGILESKGGTA